MGLLILRSGFESRSGCHMRVSYNGSTAVSKTENGSSILSARANQTQYIEITKNILDKTQHMVYNNDRTKVRELKSETEESPMQK